MGSSRIWSVPWSWSSLRQEDQPFIPICGQPGAFVVRMGPKFPGGSCVPSAAKITKVGRPYLVEGIWMKHQQHLLHVWQSQGDMNHSFKKNIPKSTFSSYHCLAQHYSEWPWESHLASGVYSEGILQGICNTKEHSLFSLKYSTHFANSHLTSLREQCKWWKIDVNATKRFQKGVHFINILSIELTNNWNHFSKSFRNLVCICFLSIYSNLWSRMTRPRVLNLSITSTLGWIFWGYLPAPWPLYLLHVSGTHALPLPPPIAKGPTKGKTAPGW